MMVCIAAISVQGMMLMVLSASTPSLLVAFAIDPLAEVWIHICLSSLF